MSAFIQFQMLHFRTDWLNPYWIFQIIIDVENCREFWRMNTPFFAVFAIVVLLTILYALRKKRQLYGKFK